MDYPSKAAINRHRRRKGCTSGINTIVREQMHPELDELDEICDVEETDESMPIAEILANSPFEEIDIAIGDEISE